MIKVSAAEFQRNIGRYQDLALRQPVGVTRNGRESCVLISTEENKRLKRRDRRVFAIEEAADDDKWSPARAIPRATNISTKN